MHHRPIGKTSYTLAVLILTTACVLCSPARAEEGLVAHYTFEEGPSPDSQRDSGPLIIADPDTNVRGGLT